MFSENVGLKWTIKTEPVKTLSRLPESYIIFILISGIKQPVDNIFTMERDEKPQMVGRPLLSPAYECECVCVCVY